MSKLKKMPEFKNEAEERESWETHDSSDYLDWSQAKSASFSKLRCNAKICGARRRRASGA
ncbi:hypothetical protein FRY77_06780 [Halomonas sp. MG34]|nr:hypothetical protein [Halomonas sp. MG34]